MLLATYNGGRYLDEQLASIFNQSIARVDVLASDDGSSDDTVLRLAAWAARWTKGDFRVLGGPRQGFAENFRSLILRAAPSVDTYVTFADQDDVWDTDKLVAAVAILARSGNVPGLYAGRTKLIDAAGRQIGLSPLFRFPPSFRNALVQSLAGGNTMTFNPAGFALLQESARRTSFLMHDWWSYLIVSGSGGDVYYDRRPYVRYRQHVESAVGGRIGIFQRPRRALDLLRGRFVRWSEANIESLRTCRDLITESSRETLARFEQLRRAPLFEVPKRLLQAGIYRQTVKGNLAMGIAVLFRRL